MSTTPAAPHSGSTPPGSTRPGSAWPEAWRGLVDDAAMFPPGSTPLPQAVREHREHRAAWYADLVGPLVVKDTDLSEVRDAAGAISLLVTGGAGSILGPLSMCHRAGIEVAAVEAALRDLDDLPGNARRVLAAVDQARDEGVLDDEVPVHLELPQSETTHGWLAAADVAAEAGLPLKFRTGGVEAHNFCTPETLAAWIDAALDRESPFKCTAGLHRAASHTDPDTGFTHHGFLGVLLATRMCFDGEPREDVVRLLAEGDPAALVAQVTEYGEDTLARTRRWFRSFGTCSVTEPLEELVALDLVPTPEEA